MTDGTGHPGIPELDRRGLVEFGLVTGGMFVLLFGLLFPWLLGFSFPLWPWIILGVLATMALLVPEWLRPVHRGWMTMALAISKVTTPVILGVVFFLVVTPMGLVMRLFRNDPMRRQLGQDTDSYRVPSNRPSKDSLERPF